MTESDTEVVEEYPHSCRIVREINEGEEDRYHYEGPLGRVKSFYSPEKARLYADVHTVTGGFREEKTGERGVPPAVARAREDVQIAYYVSTPSMGVEWTARFFDVDKDIIRDYVEIVRARAAEVRADKSDEDEDEEMTIAELKEATDLTDRARTPPEDYGE